MKMEMLIKTASNDWAAQAQVPSGLADRVVCRSRRRRRLRVGLAAGATALMVGAAIGVVSAVGPSPAATPAGELTTDTSLRADPGTFPPRRLVAAGHIALAAYDTVRSVPVRKDLSRFERTWHLYNPTSDQYEKTSWAYLDVASGMQQAAVLEGPLPTSRVGILDMNTRKVTRWIKVEYPVGGVAWAPDGRRLVLTTYDKDPDLYQEPHGGPSLRTGFYIVDAELNLGSFHRLAGDGEELARAARQDFGWSRSGTLLSSPTLTPSPHPLLSPPPTGPIHNIFYDLNGIQQLGSTHEGETIEGHAGLSPNGTLFADSGSEPGPSVRITNAKTGKTAALLPIRTAEAWVDDNRLIATGCNPKNCEENANYRFVLVGLDGRITPLTGYHEADHDDWWDPVFARR